MKMICPEAIIISSIINISYADIITKMTTDTDLKNLGRNASVIRKNQK